ncbi:universal stress protein [Marinobacteraceae bacterium S3BR75-40.1]
MSYSKLLVVLNPEENNQPVIQRARLLAQRYGAAVHLFVADYSSALERAYLFDRQGFEEARAGYIKGRERWLEEQAEDLHKEGVEVSTAVHWAKPLYEAVKREAEAIGADLVVKTTHHHSALARVLLTPGDWHLIRELSIPLLLVREIMWEDHIRLAACVDPTHEHESDTGDSSRDERILETSHDLAVQLPAELHVIHACEPMPTGLVPEFDALMVDMDSLRGEIRDTHQKALDALLENRVESTTMVHFEEGPAETVIPETVKREAIDLVVLGAVSRTGLDRLLIGSTAERVMDLVDADLLILW